MNEKDMFGVNDLNGDEVIVDATAGEEVEQSTKVAKKEVSTDDPVTTTSEVGTNIEDVKVTTAATTPQISKDELTLAQTLIEIKAAKPKATWIVEERSKKTQAKVTEGSFKRVRDELEQESAKRQRLVKEDDFAELKRCLEIVLKDDDDDDGKRVKRHAKKSTTAPTVGVAIRDAPGVSSKKKAPAKVDKSKGIEILSDVALSEAAQLKEAIKRSDSEDDNDDDDDKADSDDDVDSNADDNERTDSDDDDDENPSYEEYESDDDKENMFEEEDDDLYKDVDVDSSKQSSSVSSDFASKFLILENISSAVDEVASMMNVKSRQEESSTQAPSFFSVPVTAIPKSTIVHFITVPPTISMITPPPQLTTPSSAPTTIPTTTLIPTLLDFSSLFRFDQRVSTLETEDRDDKNKDEDPFTGPDRGLKKRKTSKDAEPPKGSKSKKSKTSSFRGTKSQPKSSGKSMQADEPVFETVDTEMPQDQEKWISNIAKARQPPRTFNELMSTPIEFSAYVMHNLKIDNLTQEILTRPAFNLLKGTCKSFVELEYHFEECYKAVTDQLDWNNPKGHEYPFYLSKLLPLIEAQGRQVVPADYFFNNDLEYLKGISNWGPKQQEFYGYASNRVSKHDVISRKRIIAVTHVKVMKWYDYGYLEEIIIQREEQTLQKCKECDFPRLNLRDIEDLLLLL
nr:hypothetical protein [Tanacetum cinerariifolium]